MARILLVEDDAHMAAGLQYNLARAGHAVQRAGDGVSGLRLALEERPDLVVLDVMLPGMDGIAVLGRLRGEGSRVPVILLSARGDDADRVRGFEAGADDYVPKPFGLGDLLARIRRRLGVPTTPASRFDLGKTTIDLDELVIVRGPDRTPLTPTEVTILRYLHAKAGATVARDELLRRIWGVGAGASRTLDTHIARLRRKLETDPAAPRHLMTVHAVGYRLVL